MEETTTIILTGLITSGFTIILSKAFDFFKLKSEYRIHRKKLYFEKKLSYAERSIEYLYNKADKYSKLANVYQQMDNVLEEKHSEVDNETWDTLISIQNFFLKDLDINDLFKTDLPSGAWFYFDINPVDLATKEIDTKLIEIIKNFKDIQRTFKEQKTKQLDDSGNAKDENILYAGKLRLKLLELQIEYKSWINVFLTAENRFLKLAKSIEKDFINYK